MKLGKIGAPRKYFDWSLVETLAILEADCRYVAERMIMKAKADLQAQAATDKNMSMERMKEIAAFAAAPITKTDIESMVKRINRHLQERYECSYVLFVAQKRENWRVKLRMLQRKTAEKGNATMQIWLGKQDLGQTDKQENFNNNKSLGDSKLIVEFTKEGGDENGSDET